MPGPLSRAVAALVVIGLTVFLVPLASVAAVIAQDEGGASPDNDPGIAQRLGRVPKARLLLLKQVHGELNLTEAQKARAAEINDELLSDVRDLLDQSNPNAGEPRRRLQRLEDQAGLRMEGLLDELQQQRLGEIWMQPMADSSCTILRSPRPSL